MKRIAGMSWALLAVPLLLAQSAQADEITVTVSGTITSGIDYDGIFGPGNASLVGDPVLITLSYQTCCSALTYIPQPGLGPGGMYGGYNVGVSATVQVGSDLENYEGDSFNFLSGIEQVDASGTPISNSVGFALNGYCAGKFSTIANLSGQYECQDEIGAGFSLTNTSGSILTQAGADALFSSATGGEVQIAPYIVPNPSYSDPGSESFAFTTDPEPATWLLASAALILIALIRAYPAYPHHFTSATIEFFHAGLKLRVVATISPPHSTAAPPNHWPHHAPVPEPIPDQHGNQHQRNPPKILKPPAEHLLKFQRKKLRRVVGIAHLPRLIHHSRNKTQRNHRGRDNGRRSPASCEAEYLRSEPKKSGPKREPAR